MTSTFFSILRCFQWVCILSPSCFHSTRENVPGRLFCSIRLTPSTARPHTFLKLVVGVTEQIQKQGIGVQVNLVSAVAHNIGNLTCRIDSSKFHETRVFLHGRTNQFGRLCLSLGLCNDRLLFLLSSYNNVLCSLRILLSCTQLCVRKQPFLSYYPRRASYFGVPLTNLFGFDGSRVFWTETQVGNGNVLQKNVEELCS